MKHSSHRPSSSAARRDSTGKPRRFGAKPFGGKDKKPFSGSRPFSKPFRDDDRAERGERPERKERSGSWGEGRRGGRPERTERVERGERPERKERSGNWGEGPREHKRDHDGERKRNFRRDERHDERGGERDEKRGGFRKEFRKDFRSDRRGERGDERHGGFRKEFRKDFRSDNRGERGDEKRDGFRKEFRKDFHGDSRGERGERGDEKRGGFRSEKRGEFRKDFRKGPPHKEHRRNDRDDRADRKPFVEPEKTSRDQDVLWGIHAVRAAWLNPERRCSRLWLTEAGHKSMAEALTEAEQQLLKRPIFKLVEREALDQLVPPGSVHQGIVLEAAPLHEPALHELISGDNPPDILLMLDQVTDPHNVGAILRSAAAFGASAVIMTERNAPNTTGVLAKTASGAVEHVPQIHVVNLSRALDDLQQAGYWCVGLAEEGERDMGALDLTSRVVLVLGAEGDGLRHLTRKKCNELARLPTGGAIGSLNVSNAAAIALYEARRQKNAFDK